MAFAHSSFNGTITTPGHDARVMNSPKAAGMVFRSCVTNTLPDVAAICRTSKSLLAAKSAWLAV